MSLSEELGRLGALHERGVLSDEEFVRAKARVLGGAPEVTAPALLAINALRRVRVHGVLPQLPVTVSRQLTLRLEVTVASR